jgi:hypothetical protein
MLPIRLFQPTTEPDSKASFDDHRSILVNGTTAHFGTVINRQVWRFLPSILRGHRRCDLEPESVQRIDDLQDAPSPASVFSRIRIGVIGPVSGAFRDEGEQPCRIGEVNAFRETPDQCGAIGRPLSA